MSERVRIRPFSNGSEFSAWESDNCGRCLRSKCEIADAIVAAYFGDGSVSEDIARRANRHEYRVDDDHRFCTEIEFSDADRQRHANWLTAQKFSLVRNDGHVIAEGRWSLAHRRDLIRNWNDVYATTGATVRLVTITEEPVNDA